METVNSYN